MSAGRFLWLALLPAYASALTVEEAVRLALKNHPSLAALRQRIRQAEGRKQQAGSEFWPRLDFSASFTKLSRTPISSGGFQRGESNPRFFSDEIWEYRFQARQEIFAWGEDIRRLHSAEEARKAAEQLLLAGENDLARETAEACYAVLLAQEEEKIAEEDLKLALENSSSADALYRRGKVSELDASRAWIQAANADVNRQQARNRLHLARQRLAVLLGTDAELEIDSAWRSEPPGISSAAAYEVALRRRPDLRALRHREESRKKEAGARALLNRPRLSTSFQYSWLSDIPSLRPSDNFRTWSAVGSVEFPFFDGFQSGGLEKEAIAEAEEIRFQIKELEQEIRLQVLEAILAGQEAFRRRKIQAENRKLARRNLAATQERYRRGLVSFLDLQDARTQFIAAQAEEARALRDLSVAHTRLAWAMGETFGRTENGKGKEAEEK